MPNFDTKTEEAFFSLMHNKKVNCAKVVGNKKSDSIPDFLCELNNYKVIFELKDLNESGTTKWLSHNFVSQNITIAGAVSRFINQCSKKFLNIDFKNFDSALIVTNLRPFIDFENTLMSQIKRAIEVSFVEHPEIGNLIVAGYNKPSNQIIAFHIFENKNSKRIIKKDFFNNFNSKYYN
ncbi:hypothetical protein KJ854_05750 [Patescibacteria group bacterium]|nr:hypothetical protein [Patescibacteria group bacterium]